MCVALAFTTSPAVIIALVALLACGLAITQPTLSALLPDMVRRPDLARATGLNQTAGVGAINVVQVFFVRDTLDASTTVFGPVSAAWTAGMMLGELLFGRLLRAGEAGRLVRLSLLLMGVLCATVAAAAGVGSVLVLVPLWLVGGLCNGGLNVCTNLVIAHRVPAGTRGRAFATMGSAVQGAGMIGFLVAGPLVDRFDPRTLVLAAGLAGLIAVLACVPPVRRAVRSEPPGEAAPRSVVLAGDSVGA